MRLCLARWRRHTAPSGFTCWKGPIRGRWAGLSLRRFGETLDATPGLGFFLHDNTDATFEPLIDFGEDLDARLSAGERSQLESELELTPLGSSISAAQAIAEILLRRGDPSGQSKWKPLRSHIGGRCRLTLAGRSLLDEPVSSTHDAWVNRRETFRADYRAARAAATGEDDFDRLKRWTGYEVLRNRLNGPEDILPPEHVADGMLEPATTIGDTFVETSDTDLESHTATGANGGFAWDTVDTSQITVVGSTDLAAVSGSGTGVLARAQTNLAGADMYSQADFVLNSTIPNRRIGLAARLSTSAWTGYCFWVRGNGNSELYEVTAESFTQIDNTVGDWSGSGTFKIEVNSTSQEVFEGVTSRLSASDTTHSSGPRAGLMFNEIADPTWDNFEAADLGAGGAPNTLPPKAMHQRRLRL